MAKTDFTKVEERLAAGLLRMMVENLLEVSETQKKQDDTVDVDTYDKSSQKQALTSLRQDLNKIMKKDETQWEKFGITKKELHRFIKDPSSLSKKDWEKLKEVRTRVNAYKKSVKDSDKDFDEKIIEEERKKHKNKRFNVKEGWLPLS